MRSAVKTVLSCHIICPLTENGVVVYQKDVIKIFFRKVHTNKYIINTVLTSSYNLLENNTLNEFVLKYLEKAQTTAKVQQLMFESPFAGNPVLEPKFVDKKSCHKILIANKVTGSNPVEVLKISGFSARLQKLLS